MIRSLMSGVSGLRNHQTMLDVVANNIANVNTVGFKSQRTEFKDAMSQLMRGPSAGIAGGLSTTNPAQLGLGSEVSSIDNNMQQGSLSLTGNPFDLAFQGEGFFRTTSDSTGFTDVQLTRAGNFQRDINGTLTTSTGRYVIGHPVAAGGGADLTNEITLTIPNNAKTVNIGQDGLVSIIDPAGAVVDIGYVSCARFPNPQGLERTANNLWRATSSSGAELVDIAGNNGIGSISSGALELSNVDLAKEFSDMIIAQRAFQANSRTISTSDEQLAELARMKR